MRLSLSITAEDLAAALRHLVLERAKARAGMPRAADDDRALARDGEEDSR